LHSAPGDEAAWQVIKTRELRTIDLRALKPALPRGYFVQLAGVGF